VDTEGVGRVLEEMVPSSLAESWDNPGWQVRIPGAEVSGILLTLDVVPGVVREAVDQGCNLIFAHHPVLFRPLKSVDLASPVGELVGLLVRGGVSVWAAHTNLDVVPWGTSFALADVLGLTDVRLLSPVERTDYKLVVYVPPSHAEAVKEAMAQAGAGRIGSYSHCFWQVLGTGQFRPEAGANPYQGVVGEEERLEELRVEGVVPRVGLAEVLEAMRRAHPYEEVAYDLLPLANRVTPFGFGAVGTLPEPRSTEEIAASAASTLSSPICQVVGSRSRRHGRVAVVGGSGSAFLGDAIKSGATLFITADVRYHEAQEAAARGLDLVVLDHFATEYPVLEAVRRRLEARLPGMAIRIAGTSCSPWAKADP